MPKSILRADVIKLLLREGVTVICAGGGGIPVACDASRNHVGVEAVIDKDHTSALLATLIEADGLLMLTDVDGVYKDWGKPGQTLISRMTPELEKELTFTPGSMGPKIEAAVSFLTHGGEIVGIGRLDDALLILNGRAGTIFVD
jgi:carbamate kinase